MSSHFTVSVVTYGFSSDSIFLYFTVRQQERHPVCKMLGVGLLMVTF